MSSRRLLLLFLTGTLVLGMAAVIARSQRSILSPEHLAVLRWFSSLGFPSAHDLPLVKVSIGRGWIEEGGVRGITIAGLLMSDNGKNFTVLDCGLNKWRLTANGHPSPTVPIYYKGESFGRFMESRVGMELGENSMLYGEEQIHLPKDVTLWLILGTWCWQKHREDLAEKFIASAEYRMRATCKMFSRTFSWQDTPAQTMAPYFFEQALLRLSEPSVSWREVQEDLLTFAWRFPNTDEAAKAQIIAERLGRTIEEGTREELSESELLRLKPEEQARLLVRRLPEVRGFYDDRVKQLERLGLVAVPALIEALDDYRLVRGVSINYHHDRYHLRVESVGEVARECLENMTGQRFEHHQYGTVFESDLAEPSMLRRQYEQWWEAQGAAAVR